MQAQAPINDSTPLSEIAEALQGKQILSSLSRALSNPQNKIFGDLTSGQKNSLRQTFRTLSPDAEINSFYQLKTHLKNKVGRDMIDSVLRIVEQAEQTTLMNVYDVMELDSIKSYLD